MILCGFVVMVKQFFKMSPQASKILLFIPLEKSVHEYFQKQRYSHTTVQTEDGVDY